MIGHAIIPSHFIVEIEGSAVNTLFPADLNVSKVIIGSLEFDSDVQAAAAAQKIIDLVCPVGTEHVDLNPEFYSLDALPDVLSEIDDEDKPNGNKLITVIPVTKKFDELGDFVGYRKTITGDDFSAKVRVLANPAKYVSERQRVLNSEYDITGEHRELLSHKPRLQ
jgi:hypothetical protein